MNSSLFSNRFSNYFRYLTIILIVLLTAGLTDAGIYARPANKTRAGLILYKQQPEPRMFLIAVIDSHDDSIGQRCEADLDEIQSAFEDYADELGADLAEPKIIEGDGFGKAAVNDVVNDWLPSQHLQSTDIVVFYYSGHGFRYRQDVGDYPRMWLKTADDRNVENNNLRIKEDIYDRIVKMGAGFNLVISDCCNSTVVAGNAYYDSATVHTRKREVHKKENSEEEDNDRDNNADKLFVHDHPVSILVTAAGKGELAGGTPYDGGFFTSYLLEALDKCIYGTKMKPSWQGIFDYADNKAGYDGRAAACPTTKHNEKGRCVQTVTFKIDTSD